jgi:hypothetical protein
MEGRISTPSTMPGLKREQGKAKCEGNVKPGLACHLALKCVDSIAFRALYCNQTKHPVDGYGEAQPPGSGAREPGCGQTKG